MFVRGVQSSLPPTRSPSGRDQALDAGGGRVLHLQRPARRVPSPQRLDLEVRSPEVLKWRRENSCTYALHMSLTVDFLSSTPVCDQMVPYALYLPPSSFHCPESMCPRQRTAFNGALFWWAAAWEGPTSPRSPPPRRPPQSSPEARCSASVRGPPPRPPLGLRPAGRLRPFRLTIQKKNICEFGADCPMEK